MTAVELVLVKSQNIIGLVSGYAGPVPRSGEWISVPGADGKGIGALRIQDVSYRILARRAGTDKFAGADPSGYQVVLILE